MLKTGNSFSLRSALIALALLLCPFVLVSCFTTGLPPGFRKSGGHVHPVYGSDINDRIVFSVLSWYKEEYGSNVSAEVRASYEDQLAAANENLFRSWSKELLTNCSPLVDDRGGKRTCQAYKAA